MVHCVYRQYNEVIRLLVLRNSDNNYLLL